MTTTVHIINLGPKPVHVKAAVESEGNPLPPDETLFYQQSCNRYVYKDMKILIEEEE